MVHVAPGSQPPSWSQNQVKVLVDAESSLYSSSVETPGPGGKRLMSHQKPPRVPEANPKNPCRISLLRSFTQFDSEKYSSIAGLMKNDAADFAYSPARATALVEQ